MERPASRELLLTNGRRIGDGQPCFIIAEIGQNHQGNIDIAKTMIAKAKVRTSREVDHHDLGKKCY